MTHYDKTTVTFHGGSPYEVTGMNAEPFATFTCDTIVDRKLIDAICALVRKHINAEHREFCNIKLTSEEWDC